MFRALECQVVLLAQIEELLPVTSETFGKVAQPEAEFKMAVNRKNKKNCFTVFIWLLFQGCRSYVSAPASELF
jgi:hypothetical protein